MEDTTLRKALATLLTGDEAHVSVRKGIDGLHPENRHRTPAGFDHSVWEQLEHMRLAQQDILRYTLDATWQSPKWPEGYWPKPGTELTDVAWQLTVDGFFADLDGVVQLAMDPKRDLTAPIPHGEGRTYLRQVLLVADHNAYHGGQLLAIRKALGDWPA
jgi:uncharacterized damage-inducible protein DinB